MRDIFSVRSGSHLIQASAPSLVLLHLICNREVAGSSLSAVRISWPADCPPAERGFSILKQATTHSYLFLSSS